MTSENDSDKAFREKLIAMRTKAGMSQHDLARSSGVSQGHISMIESGERPTPSAKIVRKLEQGTKAKVGEISGAITVETVGAGLGLDAFFASDLASDVTPEEAQSLRSSRWDHGDEASPEEWSEYLRLHRVINARQNQRRR